MVRLEWARYLNSISGMDKTVGKILKRLEADGLAGNTIVMFLETTDGLSLEVFTGVMTLVYMFL